MVANKATILKWNNLKIIGQNKKPDDFISSGFYLLLIIRKGDYELRHSSISLDY